MQQARPSCTPPTSGEATKMWARQLLLTLQEMPRSRAIPGRVISPRLRGPFDRLLPGGLAANLLRRFRAATLLSQRWTRRALGSFIRLTSGAAEARQGMA